MNSMGIDRAKRKTIIQESYRQFRIKDREGKTRSSTINEIVKIIKKELKEDAD